MSDEAWLVVWEHLFEEGESMGVMIAAVRGSLRLVGLLALGLFCLGLGFGAAVSFSGALAQPSGDDMIFACASKYTGVMRFVTDEAHCAGHESVVKWNATGIAGPPGPPGPAGEDMSKTIAGIVGADGSQYGSGFTSSLTDENTYKIEFPVGTFNDSLGIPIVTPTSGQAVNYLALSIQTDDGSGRLMIELSGETVFTFNVIIPEAPTP